MSNIEHVTGSGNVFEDLGLPDSALRLQKSELAIKIARLISDKGLSQKKAADIMGIDQPKVSMIKRGLLKDFSIERLMLLLSRLGDPHEIRPKSIRAFNFDYSKSTEQPLLTNSYVRTKGFGLFPAHRVDSESHIYHQVIAREREQYQFIGVSA